MTEVPVLVEAALGTPLVIDPDAHNTYLEGGYMTLEPRQGEQRYAHRVALQGVARHRFADRQQAAAENEVFEPDRWQLHPSQLEELGEELEPIANRIKLINSLDRYVAGEGYTTDQHTLKEHQIPVFPKTVNFLSEHKGPDLTKLGHITMPMGSGKTVVFAKLVEAFNRQEEPVKTLILVPGQDDLNRTIGRDGKKGFGKFAGDLNVTGYYQHEKDLSGDVVVMTYSSFNALRRGSQLPDDFCDVVICDEAHRTLGPATKANLGEFSRGKVAIGLTATPAYHEGKKVEELFEHQIHHLDFREAIDGGILSPVQCWLYKTDCEIDLDPSKPQEYTQKELERMAELEARNRAGVQFARSFVSQGLRGIISCIPGENVEHPREIARMLTEEPITAPARDAEGKIRRDRKGNIIYETRPLEVRALSGSLKPHERQKIYDDFDAGKVDVLAHVDLIREGWDSEYAKFLINLRPRCTEVGYKQQFGRILRPSTDDEFPLAYVIDFLDVTKKYQYTALHALGEDDYDPDRVYGRPPESMHLGENSAKRVKVPDDLRSQITSHRLRKVRDLIVSPNYVPTHSSLVNLAEASETHDIPEDVIYHLARYLRLELVNKEWPDGEAQLCIETRHLTAIQQRLKLTAMAFLRRRDTTVEQRQPFMESMFEGRDAENAAALITNLKAKGASPRELAEIAAERAEQAARDEALAAERAAVTVGRVAVEAGEAPNPLRLAETLNSTAGLTDEAKRDIARQLQQHSGLAVALLEVVGQQVPNYAIERETVGYKCVALLGDQLATARARQEEAARLWAAQKLLAQRYDLPVDFQAEDEFIALMPLMEPIDDGPASRHALNQYGKAHGVRARFETTQVGTIGNKPVFGSAVTSEVAGRPVTARGEGLNKRDAESRASVALVRQEAALQEHLPAPVEETAKQAPTEAPAEPAPAARRASKGERYFTVGDRRYDIPANEADSINQWKRATGLRVEVVVEPRPEMNGFVGKAIIHYEDGSTEVIESPPKRGRTKAKQAIGPTFAKAINGRHISP